ncbi:MAG: TrbI/VirB10 family protein [Pseudomonadota bacterium]
MNFIGASRLKGVIERLSPKQRQYAALAIIMACGIGSLWAVFALTGNNPKIAKAQASAQAGTAAPTNIGVMVPGQQVNQVDQWVGTAGRKLAQYEHEREDQSRINRDRKEFEDRTMQRFGELEQRLTSAAQAKPATPAPAPIKPIPAAPPSYPPTTALPANLPPAPGRPAAIPGMPFGKPVERLDAPMVGLVHASLAGPGKAVNATTTTPSGPEEGSVAQAASLDTFLPVSFTRGILLGGLDAPTGGQSQSNPHPVLIRLSDNSVLPNRFRAEYRECLVIAAGYGNLSSQRAYLRTENLSCVREDGSALEIKIQGSIFGEDGKVGMRGRVVEKQGQMLANALLAGVASGLGQGLATSSSTTSTSALGTIASASGADAYRAGIGTGVGRALDRLAQYYIKLAEQTFPIIEIDAGREIDIVITKGVRIDTPPKSRPGARTRLAAMHASPEENYIEESSDENY